MYDWGDFSNIIDIVASGVPDKPPDVVVSLSNNQVKFKFDPPATTNFASVTSYQLKIYDNSYTTSHEELTYCDASDSDIISQLYCLVPMTTITASVFNIAVGSPIVAQVRAYNINGWSSFSDDNSVGINAQTVPDQITTFIEEDSDTTES